MEDRKKYSKYNTVLQNIHSKFIALDEEVVRRNNRILHRTLDAIISKMKEHNPLFKKLFQRIFYGGSFYDGLRVGSPNEFDLDVVFTLPENAGPVLKPSDAAGFVYVEFTTIEKFVQTNATQYSGLRKIMEGNFIDNSKVRSWMEGLVQLAVTSLGGSLIMPLDGVFTVRVIKAGPAFTLKISNDQKKILIDVDLVPCFVMKTADLKLKNIRANKTRKPEFFLVPKPYNAPAEFYDGRHWRLSFPEQERELINNLQLLKPSIKLLKKMRDCLGHSPIASYYLKTVALWLIDEMSTQKEFQTATLSQLFMTMLKKYYQYLERREIPFYWDNTNNMLSKLNPSAIENIRNRIKKVIDDIDKHLEEPDIILKYLLTEEEIKKYSS